MQRNEGNPELEETWLTFLWRQTTYILTASRESLNLRQPGRIAIRPGHSSIDNWGHFVDQHSRLVFNVAWRILGHAQDAEDVVQQVFMEAYQIWNRDHQGGGAGLLRRLATFRALDKLRRRTAFVALDQARVASNARDPVADVIGRELDERLREAIADLPERQASVFCLRYFDCLSYEQISKELDISTDAVGNALMKARKKLESLLLKPRTGDRYER
jgi:RNA polymerase sigma-70 factor (ECF subfamily)